MWDVIVKQDELDWSERVSRQFQRHHLIAMVRALAGEITRIVEEGVPVKTFYDPLSQADVVAWADREASDEA